MRIEPLHAVLLAREYERMRDWYVAALELQVDREWEKDYRYVDLVHDGKSVLGIVDLRALWQSRPLPRRNALILHLQVDDIRALFTRLLAMDAGIEQLLAANPQV